MNGFYYLHTNGELIYKPDIVADDPEYFNSPFVKHVWRLDFSDRFCAWKIVLEALDLGCNIERAKELSEKWKLDFSDSLELLKRTDPSLVTESMQKGLEIFIKEILKLDVDDYWEKVKEMWG